MPSLRRSNRLSSTCGVEVNTHTPSTPNRKSEVWRLREPKNADGSSEESDDPLNVSDLSTLKEYKENHNPSRSSTITKSKNKEITSSADCELKTPRSSNCRRPMPLCKRKELQQAANKRKSANDLQAKAASSIDTQGISPPKVTRREHGSLTQAQHLISPSRLLDRLSIDEPNDASSSDTESKIDKRSEIPKTAALTKPKIRAPSTTHTKYQNARRVLNSAETLNLPGREEQLQNLRDFLTEHLREQRSGSLYVSGQPGTGKTACLSLLLRSPEFSRNLQCVYINCTSIASAGSVYKKLCAELNISPGGRSERHHLDAIKRHLRNASRMILIVLDEIDQLCSSRQSVLYTIFEWPALPGAKLLLIGIANSLDLTDRALIRLNARCELKPSLMHFPPYTKQQIVEIFHSRLEEAGVLDVFPPVTLQLLAAKVSAVSGDVRRALDIGRRVVEIAEQQKKAGQRVVNLNELEIGDEPCSENMETLKPVQVTQVVEVLNKVYGVSQNLEEDIEASFPLQQKLMLCSLILMLRNEKNKDINMGRLHEVYGRVCKKRNICALDQAEFAGLVDLVETRGIVRVMRKKEPRLSKVRLQWDEEEVNAALQDKQLIATILNDTACLRSGI